MTPPPLPRTAVRDLPAYVPGRRADSALVDAGLVAALASNESHFPPLPSVLDTVHEAAGRLNRYPDNAALELRTRLAARLGAGVTVDELAVGPGSTGVLQQILTGYCEPGDEVLFAWRSFDAYPILTRLVGASAVQVPLGADEGHDLDALLDAVTERTRVVLLCTPNNPTGVSIGAAELQHFLDRLPPTVLVVIDEAYLEYAEAPPGTADTIDAIALRRRHPNVCVLRTFSKAYGLAGLRVGYAVADPQVAEGLRRTAMPFAVSALAQQAAIASLEPAADTEIAQRLAQVRAERARLIGTLRARGWTTTDSAANFIWLRMRDDARDRVIAALAADDILVRGYADAGVRISVADRAAGDRVLAVLAGFDPLELQSRRGLEGSAGARPTRPLSASGAPR
ncbi:histidinol-phosphate transaminase [Herbiconiux moechotypicola]|uniref:Aromatic amino acid aminotransferase n=1 Tax=Herbiconiux moechotypicola TaxID=637393 RepID=A0ABN3D9Z8_9MICO|nr:histidinol-phosphate transaminase [Herbiconiux moechotypicola]MCS5729094.1 histidinol-phosphate transaminase [Herbiconiux moechotypicola]